MKHKVLVAEDEPFFIEAFALKLDNAGFEVCAARNGAEAVSKAKSEKPHLIIMDVMMPIMSGFDATQKLRADSATEKIPIIIFTAKMSLGAFFEGMKGVEIISKTAGVDNVIARAQAILAGTVSSKRSLKRALLLGVEDVLVGKIREVLKKSNFEVISVLNENEAVMMTETLKPEAIFCQLWEDSTVLDAPKIAHELASKPAVAQTPVYVYCKEALTVEAMKHFKSGNILTYKESSDLLAKLEALFPKKENPT